MAKRKNVPHGMPDYSALINPTISALQALGGSAKVSEIYDEVVRVGNYSDEVLDFPHTGSQSELQYRLHWARYYLKAYGVINCRGTLKQFITSAA